MLEMNEIESVIISLKNDITKEQGDGIKESIKKVRDMVREYENKKQ